MSFDTRFERLFEKYKSRLNDKQKDNLRQKLIIFKEDIFDPILKTHKLSGKLKDYYSFSITHKDRIRFKLLDDGDLFSTIYEIMMMYIKDNLKKIDLKKVLYKICF